MGRYQYELSHCNDTAYCYMYDGYTWTNYRQNQYEISLCANSCVGGACWNKPTGVIRWNTVYSTGCNCQIVLSAANLAAYNCSFYKDDMRITNDFPTDRIVIASMYGFMVDEECTSSRISWQMMPIGQRQMFILPTGCTVCYCMACNITNLNRLPNGQYTYYGQFPGGTDNAQYTTVPYFASVESYPLPVLNSNGHTGDNGASQYTNPTAICSTGAADTGKWTIPIYNSGYIDCCPSCFETLDGCGEGPALKGPLLRYNILKGKLSADSNSSAKDAYVLVSACGSWSGENTVPDNVAMVIANYSFPMGQDVWNPYDNCTNQMSRVIHKITRCICCDGSLCNKRFSYPVYGPKNYNDLRGDNYCFPFYDSDTYNWFNVPPLSDKLVPHITENTGAYCIYNYYGCIRAWSTVFGTNNPPWLCNPLAYWTYRWSNGNSYYAVNTHCT